MNVWIAKLVILGATIAMIAIRAPHGRRSRRVPVERSRKDAQELVLLTISYLIAMFLLIALRIGPEERMMHERFGKDYEAYMAKTRRLIPGVW